ncbi:MAG TPA: hypothetical protein VG891_02655 [Rhizomicrobium sp.]|jgi:hypothetical protein|nr:hypothetical protein [Rhizomicrobium sp.]
MPGLAPRFLWCVPAVFVIGVTALAASWGLFYVYHPDGFVGTLPSISETISIAPGSIAFQVLMCVVTPCIVVSWLLNYNASRWQIAQLEARGDDVRPASALNLLSCTLGIAAGMQLAGLSALKLHSGDFSHEWHIWLSEGFYSSQVLSFLIDGVCAAVRSKGTVRPAQARSLRARIGLGIAAAVTALAFLYLYVSRQDFSDAWLAQALYVTSEYMLATLCFAYPMAAYPELRAFYLGAVREEATV